MLRTSIEVDPDAGDGGIYYERNIWYGPGWYNGVFFDSEIEYRRWHYNRYYHRGYYYPYHHGYHRHHHGHGHHGKHHKH